jgi:hypothetical protein
MRRRDIVKLFFTSTSGASSALSEPVLRRPGKPDTCVRKYPRTIAEIAAGVSSVNDHLPPGQVDRYFKNDTPGRSDATLGFKQAIAQAQQLNARGVPIGAPITVDSLLAIASPVTIPAADARAPAAPVLLRIMSGSIAIAPTASLTIEGTFSAARTTVFPNPDTAGPVVLAAGSVAEAYPEWWGARADSNAHASLGTDSTAPLRAALLACAGGANSRIGLVPIKLAAGYYMTGPQILPPATALLGTGREQCGFVAAAGTSGTWFTDHAAEPSAGAEGAAKIIIDGIAFYCNGALANHMTNGLVLGYQGAFGTEGYLRGVWVRDCACAGGGWHLDVLGNVAFFDMVCIQGNNAPNQNLMRLSGGGGGNMLRNIDLIAAGPDCSSLYQASPSCMISGLEIEAPGSTRIPSTTVRPLYIGANTTINGLLLSGADNIEQDAWIEFGASATTASVTGLTYVFNRKRTARVANGNMRRADGSYFGGNATGGGSTWTNTAEYVPGDMVNLQEVVYICERANSAAKPPNDLYWRTLTHDWAPHGGEGNYFSETAFLKPQAFHLRLSHNGLHGLQHRISDAYGHAVNSANLIRGASNTFGTTPTSALPDGATPFVQGAKISSSCANTLVLASAGWPSSSGANTQRVCDSHLTAGIAINSTAAPRLSVVASFRTFDTNGTERNYLSFAFFDAGSEFPLNTETIGAGDFIDVEFSGYLSP